MQNESYYKGINNLNLDLPNQVEFNRRKNVEQDETIETLNSRISQLESLNPAGFLPKVYYGLTRGSYTYRFTEDQILELENTSGANGTSYEIYSTNPLEEGTSIPAICVKISDNPMQWKIVIQGDFNYNSTVFKVVNMTTGATSEETISSGLQLLPASYLGQYTAADYKEKQITVLNNLETNTTNVVFASLDLNSDNIYNWVAIGNFTNGTDGKSFYPISSATYSQIISRVKVGDTVIPGSNFTADGNTFEVGNLYYITSLSPLLFIIDGNIKGAKGDTGNTGATGANGADGYTPYIQDDYWYINGTNTGVKAIGTDGQNGQDGQAFNIQQGLYSTPDNWGESGNEDPEGNPLLQLPTLPQTNIQGKGFVVYDPLTTPLAPYYDLYWADNNDSTWTIIHPFSGIAGKNGTDGETPYISGGTWWIGSTNTGVSATGPQGPTGPTGPAAATYNYDSTTHVLTITTP